jgi:threonine aldolase
MIDLRSDTVTRPSVAMRRAMADAEVGDDVYGEDPTVRRLEEKTADLLGKDAALFVPSGTMANQIALMVHCRPGDEVIVGEGSHIFYYEGGAGGAFAGVQFVEVGSGGLFEAPDFERAIKPSAYYLARSRLVVVENTHNRAGGLVFPAADFEAITARACDLGLAVHVDGARLWNAAIATGRQEKEIVSGADTVSACFSKGLGAPVGSVLAGTRAHVAEARRLRRMLGGGMRQSGILAAAALYALDHHRERLVEDHDRARRFARAVQSESLRPRPVETNVVLLEHDGDAFTLASRAAEAGVLVHAVAPTRLRAVTHMDATEGDVVRAAEILARVAGG